MTGAFGGNFGDTRFPGIGFFGGHGCSGSLQHVSTPKGSTPIEIAIYQPPGVGVGVPGKIGGTITNGPPGVRVGGNE